MKRGLLVPNKVVLDMIKETMLAKKSVSKGFLIDGYPRAVNQGVEFENEVIFIIKNKEKFIDKLNFQIDCYMFFCNLC
jgi:adenylate kinase family enzyme